MNTKFNEQNATKLALMVVGNINSKKANLYQTYHIKGDNEEQIKFQIEIAKFQDKNRYFIEADHSTYPDYNGDRINSKQYQTVCRFFNKVNKILTNYTF